MSRRDGVALVLALSLLTVPLAWQVGWQAIPGWADGPAVEVTPVGGLLFGTGLDPNHASARDLTVLPGIGPARAEAIVAYRAHAGFCRLEDLESVHGLGPRTVARLQGWLAIEPAAPGCSAPAKG
ncbi:MAG: helix-hairpin-helix domain-containing protein [bacterium]|nr:helix-hairpin-helix domain-containing protein [bacterium]MCP5067553.1 helix-hairpin-helix domain-containing protein [bacterium]